MIGVLSTLGVKEVIERFGKRKDIAIKREHEMAVVNQGVNNALLLEMIAEVRTELNHSRATEMQLSKTLADCTAKLNYIVKELKNEQG